jgi:hypothetical protein
MRNRTRAWPWVLVLWTLPLHAQTEWVSTGSGSDTTLTLEAPLAASLDLRSKKAARAKLILKCHDKKPMVGVFIGALNEPFATVRFDKEPAFKADLRNRTKWGLLWTTQTVVDPETKFFEKPAEIAAALLRHQTLLVRVTPAEKPTQEVVFQLAPLLPELPAFEQACGLEKPIERPAVASATAAAAPAARASSPATAKPTIEKFGEWRRSISTSSIDDRPIVLLSLTAAKGSSAKRSANLMLRCREKVADVFLGFPFGLDGPPASHLAVRASVDGSPQAKEWWLSPSTDRAVFFFSAPPQILKRMLASKELRLSYRPAKRPETYTWMPEGESIFPLAGLDQASQAFLDACPVDLAKVKVKDGLPALP